jgi:hypothetical protein
MWDFGDGARAMSSASIETQALGVRLEKNVSVAQR